MFCMMWCAGLSFCTKVESMLERVKLGLKESKKFRCQGRAIVQGVLGRMKLCRTECLVTKKKQNRELGEFNLFLIWFLVCNVMTSRFRGSNFIYLQSCFGKLCHSQHFLLPSLVLWESKSIEFCHSIGARAPTNERTSWGNSSSTGAWVKSRNLFGTKRMTSLSWGPQKADCFG